MSDDSYGSGPSDLRNEDWIKTLEWDLPARTLDELHERWPEYSDDDWRALPAIEAAPPAIRAALGLPER